MNNTRMNCIQMIVRQAESRRKMLIRAAALVAILLVSSSAASARTCEQIAQACTKQGGVPATCFEQNRMKRCKSTGTYTAPNGTPYPADKN
jgi:hypothetical protein